MWNKSFVFVCDYRLFFLIFLLQCDVLTKMLEKCKHIAKSYEISMTLTYNQSIKIWNILLWL